MRFYTRRVRIVDSEMGEILTFEFDHDVQITDDYAKSTSSEIAGRRFDAFIACIKMNPKVRIHSQSPKFMMN